jgi:hypothetical protein
MLSFKTDVNVPTVSNKKNMYKIIIFCWHLEIQDAKPDLVLDRVPDLD